MALFLLLCVGGCTVAFFATQVSSGGMPPERLIPELPPGAYVADQKTLRGPGMPSEGRPDERWVTIRSDGTDPRDLGADVVAAMEADGWVLRESGTYEGGEWRSVEDFEGEYGVEVYVHWDDDRLVDGEPRGDGEVVLWLLNYPND
jgi:hypothetical protein